MAGQTVTVSVLAETNQFSRAMKRLGNDTGLSRLGAGFRRVGASIGRFVKRGVLALGALGAAIVGLALKGGFERALKIEDAEAKLKGLGHSTRSIERIMESALGAVKGTAFGLDEAATAAATAVAAGVQPGRELEHYLTLVGDAATIAGVSMGEMGAIFNKVTTSGRAQTMELNQIADRGIPIWTELADHYGVTADELRKMVSSGKVDAETFQTVMNDILGGSAQSAGDTTRGAFANMRAALSRVGEALLRSVFPMFRDAMGGITEWLDKATDAVGPLGERMSAWITDTAVPALKDFWNWLRANVVPALGRMADTIKSDVLPVALDMGRWIVGTAIPALVDFGKWIVENRKFLLLIVGTLGAFVAGIKAVLFIQNVTKAVKAATVAFKAFGVALLANPITLVVGAIAALVAGLVWFFTQTELGQKIWTKVWGGIKAVASAVADWFTGTLLPVLSGVWEGIKAAAQSVADWYNTNLAPVFAAFGELIAAIFGRIVQWAQFLWTGIRPVLNFIGNAWKTLWSTVQANWKRVGPPLLKVIKTAFKVMGTVLKGIWNNIKIVIKTALNVIKGVIKTVTRLIKGDWRGAWNSVRSVARTIWNGIRNVIRNSLNTIRRVIRTIVNGVKSFWSSAWSSVRQRAMSIFSSIRDGVRSRLRSMIDYVRNIPSRIRSIFSNAGSWLLAAGRNIISGFINGIRARFQSVRNTLSSLTNLLPSWKGPREKDKTLLTDAGRLIIDGFINGMEGKYSAVRRSLGGLTRMVGDTDMGSLGAPEFATAGAAGRGAAPVINVYALTAGPEVGRQVHKALQDYERANGRRGR